MKKSVWFKILSVIIIQAILLTQAEFACAAIFSSKDLCREAALTYQKVTSHNVSLIFGIGCLQLNAKSLYLEKLFSLLFVDNLKLAENLSASKSSNITNEIYKVFALAIINAYAYNNCFENLISQKAVSAFNWKATTQESRAPPVKLKNIESVTLGRIV
jgi:hypothetical protein